MTYKIGLLTFSDGRRRVHLDQKDTIEKYTSLLLKTLKNIRDVEVVQAQNIVWTPQLAKTEAKKLLARDVDCVILNIPIWVFPHLVVIAARHAKPPFILVANDDPKTASMVGMMASAGSLEQLEIPHERLWGNFKCREFQNALRALIVSASTVNKLSGQQYGLFGGRSLGMYTALASQKRWQKQFGIDIEHIDELALVDEAKKVPKKEIEKHFQWLKRNVGKIVFDDTLTPDKLKQQISFYLATKQIVAREGFDFIGIKCQPELSENYCTQCLTAAFMNDPYDADGKKEPVVTACEIDMDGALTMQILKLISNKPVLFFDFRHYDPQGFYIFCNCGAQATWYAARSESPKENLSKVTFMPQAFYYKAGGATTQYICMEGEVTLARLFQVGEKYKMAILPGKFTKQSPDKLKETTPQWPHAFVKLEVAPKILIHEYNSNHAHAVAGNYVEELTMVCKFLNIEPVVYR
jgi:L-fucose isomerase